VLPSNNNSNTAEDWNFYFGRGGYGNQRRHASKANMLVFDLAARYSQCEHVEKRIFAKQEVYDKVIQNGGRFQTLKIDKSSKKETATEETDTDKIIAKIMQNFRDINKQQPLSQPHISLQQQQPQQTPIPTPPRRPKRRCIRPSIVEPPEFFNLAERSNNNGYTDEQNQPKEANHNNAFEEAANIVEPPKFESTFSALIMTDELTSDLPTTSQRDINHNLHMRVQRLENLVTMLMQQKNDEIEVMRAQKHDQEVEVLRTFPSKG